jgi:hypothetical protein
MESAGMEFFVVGGFLSKNTICRTHQLGVVVTQLNRAQLILEVSKNGFALETVRSKQSASRERGPRMGNAWR